MVEEKMIDEIIEQFDFKRCYSDMRALSWEWTGTGIPTIDMLKESAVNRLRAAIKKVQDKENRLSTNDVHFSSSGGLKGSAWKNRYGHVAGIKLEFVLTEWDSDGD